MRTTTELVALAMARSGSFDSAAAMVAISAPTIEKITTTMPEKTAPTPLGKNPPCAVRLREVQALVRPDARARTGCRARGRRMIAATLMPANQNSNSPNELTENRLVAVISSIRTERQQPQRRVEPVGEDLGPGDRLEADDDDPEVPVQPADGEARPAAERLAGVVGEGAGRGVGRGHLAEHPHHQDDQHAGERVGEERRRARSR